MVAGRVAGTTLAALLDPYRWRADDVGDWDTDLDDLGWRFFDVPADVAGQAIDVVEDWMSRYRPNAQPPARWLVDQARDLDGLLAGLVMPRQVRVRVDGIKVPRDRAVELARRVRDTWPAANGWPPALDLALAEAWPSWSAEDSTWEGPGTQLLQHLPDGAVIGLWWD